MPAPKPQITLFERPGPRKRRVSGVGLALNSGDGTDSSTVTWNVAAKGLAGLVPQAGDQIRAGDGTRWSVTSVAAEANGAWPCTCAKGG